MPREFLEELHAPDQLSILRTHPDGEPLLVELHSPASQSEPASTSLFSYDTYGQRVINPFAMESETLEGLSDGWLHTITERQNGLPTKVNREKVGREFGENMAATFRKILAEKLGFEENADNIIEAIRQEVHYAYSDTGQLISAITYQEIVFKEGTLFGENRLFLPVQEKLFHYDDEGRLHFKVEYDYDDNQLKKVGSATYYRYKTINEERVSITKARYSNVGSRELKAGAMPSSVTVTDINPHSKEQLGYAVYKDERQIHHVTLSNYYFLKRMPYTIGYQRETPKAGMNWLNWEEQPQSVRVPSYITEQSITKYLTDNDKESLLADPIGDVEIEALYFEEFVPQILKASPRQAIRMAVDILTAKTYVQPAPFLGFSLLNQEEQRKALVDFGVQMHFARPDQKAAALIQFLPLYAFMANQGLKPHEEISSEILTIADKLCFFPAEERAAFVREHRELRQVEPTNPTNLLRLHFSKFLDFDNEGMEFFLDVIENLENFPEMAVMQTERFEAILKQ